MRIIHTESSVVMGGQERRVLSESVGMRERGHDVWIVTPRGGELDRRARASGLDVVPLSFSRAYLPLNAIRLAAIVRSLRPDVLNSHSSADSWTAALARRMGARRGALIRSRHISAPVAPGPLHRFAYGEADHVITTGESVRAGLVKSGLVPAGRSTSIPTGVDVELFRPRPEQRAQARASLGLPLEALVIGVVAYLRADKGHTVLLHAMPAVLEAHPDCVLCIVGEGTERTRLEAQIGDLDIEASVRFTGSREDVPDLLPAFDVFCLPSVRNEGVPQSLLQASSAGLPVVSTRVGGIPEAVVDRETGLVVDPGSESDLARSLSRLLADPELRQRFGERGRQHVSAGYSLRHMLDLTERAYAEALDALGTDRRMAAPESAGR